MKTFAILGSCLLLALIVPSTVPAAPEQGAAATDTRGTAAGNAGPAPATKRVPRMYPGAPPVVTHDVEERMTLCLDCHATGTDGAPLTPHPTRTHFCVQCHVEQDTTAKPFAVPKLFEPAKRK